MTTTMITLTSSLKTLVQEAMRTVAVGQEMEGVLLIAVERIDYLFHRLIDYVNMTTTKDVPKMIDEAVEDAVAELMGEMDKIKDELANVKKELEEVKEELASA